ncbi:response regulator, partial [uncultured Thiodictyon sp.]|uniref:response regulator n=1 Tax=uncultured Thiodictyon sp. TaxID=1846217 RepID=UPI0025F74AA1
QPHVVFMDMRMPVMSGEEATREIRARMAVRPGAVGTIIVALTASAFNEHRDRFLSCGCDDFAGKPWRAEELFAILERRAGLRFVRADHASVASAAFSACELTSRLGACPAGWRGALNDAVALGDFGRITTLIAQLDERDDALRTLLSQWAYNYDLESFSQVLREGG